MTTVKEYLMDEHWIRVKRLDAKTPGFKAVFTPEEADYAGAFFEGALSIDDALDALDGEE